MAVVCTRCSASQGILSLLTADLTTGSNICPKCVEAEQQRVKHLKQLSLSVIVTTTPSIDGYRVTAYLGIESVEYVIVTGFLAEATTNVQDFFGGRSTAFENKLAIAKQEALSMLKFRAAEKGAHAVVATDIDYTEFSGNRVALIINGTLVQMAAVEQPISQKSHFDDRDGAPNRILQTEEPTAEEQVQVEVAPTSQEPKRITQSEAPRLGDEEQAAELFAQARQLAQNAEHQNAASVLREIVRRYPTTQIADKARRTLQKSGITAG